MPDETEKPYRGVIQTLLSLAKNHRRQFAIVSLFALLATAADLLQPLVYRRAISEVAGLPADKPRLLVLDEATANLDYATELEFKQSLLNLNPRPTTLIIAHRYTMIKEADFVYILNDGQVVEEGTPAALLAANGWFTQLARQSSQPAEQVDGVTGV